MNLLTQGEGSTVMQNISTEIPDETSSHKTVILIFMTMRTSDLTGTKK
jgi:hypothetical protein